MGWRTFTCTLMRINKSWAANRKPVLEEKSSGQQFHTTDQKQALSNKGKMNKDNKLFFLSFISMLCCNCQSNVQVFTEWVCCWNPLNTDENREPLMCWRMAYCTVAKLLPMNVWWAQIWSPECIYKQSAMACQMPKAGEGYFPTLSINSDIALYRGEAAGGLAMDPRRMSVALTGPP